MKLEHSLIPYTKINSKWIKHLNVRLDTINLLEENRQNIDIYCSKIFFDPPPRVMRIKANINKWDLIKLKSFSTAKELLNKMKRQSSELRKYLQMKQMTKDSSPKYTHISCSSLSKNNPITSSPFSVTVSRS